MKHKLLSLLLTLTLVLGCAPCSFADGTASGLGNFTAVNTYQDGQFTDVKSNDWFSSFVASAFRLNLMSGNSATTFNPNGNVTIAETITVAAKLHAIYATGNTDCIAPVTGAWYAGFVDYALKNGIISATYADYSRPATRAEYASILSKAFPESAFPVISDIDDNAIPDVPVTRSYAPAVYMLYRAGVLSGSDSKGNFKPDSSIKRSEVATILIKMADPSQRKEMSLKVASSLDAVAVSEKCSSAVFYIEIYDKSGYALASGSGFFIDSDGTAVTNYHVIDGASSARIMLKDGTVKDVCGVYDYNEDMDLALLEIDGTGYDYLEFDTSAVVAGQTVFAIGSPLGLDNTISQGIVSNPKRHVDNMDYIQFTAPISHGNSGGALLNDSGKVIGVSSAFFDSDGTAQNLNLAIPVSYINQLSHTSYTPLSSITGGTSPVSSGSVTGSLSLEYSEYAMTVGESGYIPIYFEANDCITVEFSSPHESVVYCEWGDFEDDWIPLNIEAVGPGTAVVTINLYDDSETQLLDTTTFTVSVSYASGASDKLSYLKNQIVSKGYYSASSQCYTLSSEIANGIVSVSYTPSTDEIDIIFGSTTYDNGGTTEVLCGFTFTKISDSYEYLLYCELTPYGVPTTETTGVGTLNPRTFTDSTYLRFDTYVGLSALRDDAEEIAASALCLALYGADMIFLEYGIDFSVYDLNFTNF